MEPAPRKRRLRPRYVATGLVLLLLASAIAILYVVTDDPVTRMPPKSAIPANLPPEVRKDIEDLYSTDVRVREVAIDHLRDRPEAIPFLVGLLGDVEDPDGPPKPEFSWEYVKQFLIPPEPEISSWRVGGRAAERLVSYGPQGFEALKVVLRTSKNQYARGHAVLGLGQDVPIYAEGDVVAALSDPSRHVRQEAATVFRLTLRPCPAAMPVLIALQKKDPSPQVRYAALRALCHLEGAPEVGVAFVEALGDKDSDICEGAARGLRGCKDPRAVRGLIGALGHSDADVRSEAATSLGSIGDLSAVAPLAGLVNDPEYHVRKSVILALRALADAGVEDPTIADAIVAALEDSDFEVRLLATVSVSHTRGSRATAALLGLLQGSYEKNKWYAARALGEIGDKGAVDPLIEMLKAPAGNQRSVAAFALGLLGDSRAVPPLLDALKDPDEKVRASAADSLGWLEAHEAVEALKGLVSDPCPEVRAAAARSLGRLGGTWTSPGDSPR